MRARRLSLLALSSVLCLVALSAYPQTPELPPGTLVVLLSGAPGTPTAEEIVSSSNQSEALPGGFATGSPLGARTLISYRASGTFREWMDQNPDHPRSQLERMVILSYPAYVDLASVEATLAEDPAVKSVGEDTTSDFYVVPNDPLMQIPSVPDPLLFQWGAYILNLPAAWDKATGHGYVGIVDVGIQGEIAGYLIEPDPNQDGELHCRGLTGFETGQPDLRAFDTLSGTLQYFGGGMRNPLSRDFGNEAFEPYVPLGQRRTRDLCVDERHQEFTRSIIAGTERYRHPDLAGHGTHLAGIVASTGNNSLGSAGTNWHGSLMIGRAAHLEHLGDGVIGPVSNITDDAAAIVWLVEQGAQVINMSWGNQPEAPLTEPIYCDSSNVGHPDTFTSLCLALAYAADRDSALVAASGNDRTVIAFPARDPRVIAVGGIQFPATFWDDPSNNVGSNFGPEQELAAPAKDVMSTFYEGQVWNPNPGADCQDSNFPLVGYGRCTGTSMAAPHVAGAVGLLRSVNPLVSTSDLRLNLRSYASGGGVHSQQLGYGVPNVRASADALFGTAAGRDLNYRLTPLFSLYSTGYTDHLYTTVPQMATAALFDIFGAPHVPTGPMVWHYTNFPGIGCEFSPCWAAPRASVYLFTSDHNPLPSGPGLVPLYRMLYRPYDPTTAIPTQQNPNPEPNTIFGRSRFYTINEAGLLAGHDAGYGLEGIEGYLHPLCGSNASCSPDPACQPPGSVPLHRRYHPGRDDYAIFPESELAVKEAEGYTTVAGGQACLGYVNPNVDSDGDTLIDGYEILLGTSNASIDSDCDGVSDALEVYAATPSDPLGAPGCTDDKVFLDSFENGTTSQWTGTVTSGGGSLSVVSGSAPDGAWRLSVGTSGAADAQAYAWDGTPAAESHYRARFHFRRDTLTMPDGSSFYLAIGRSASTAIFRLPLRYQAGVYSVRLQLIKDDGSATSTAWVELPAGTPVLEIEWQAAASALTADGFGRLWINGVPVGFISLVDNDGHQLESVRIGAAQGVVAGTVGTFTVDGFVSRQHTYVGY